MPILRGNDPGVFMSFAQQFDWQATEADIDPVTAAAGTNDMIGQMFSLPLISADVSIPRDRFTESAEISTLGARIQLEDGTSSVRLTIRLRPRYADAGMIMLAGYGMGGRENYQIAYLNQDVTEGIQGLDGDQAFFHTFQPGWERSTGVDGAGVAGGYHAGLFVRLHYGQTIGSAGQTILNLRGCFINRMTWTQDAAAAPIVEFEFIGISASLSAWNEYHADEDPTEPVRNVFFKARDLKRDTTGLNRRSFIQVYKDDGGVVSFGNELTSFSWTLNHNLEFPTSSLESVTTHSQPVAPTATWDLNWTLGGLLTQKPFTQEHPIFHFAEDEHSGFFVAYSSFTPMPGSDSTNLIGYGSRFLCRGKLTEAAAPIDRGGVIEWSATGIATVRPPANVLPQLRIANTLADEAFADARTRPRFTNLPGFDTQTP